HHEWQAGFLNRLEDREKLAMIMHADSRHMRIGTARIDNHEDLEGENSHRRQPRNLFQNRGCRIHVVIDNRLLLVQCEDILKDLGCRWRRADVGHAHTDRHPAGSATLCCRDQIFLVGETWLPMVRVHVDQTGQEVKPPNVHDTFCLVRFAGRGNAHDLLSRNRNISAHNATSFGDDDATLQKKINAQCSSPWEYALSRLATRAPASAAIALPAPPSRYIGRWPGKREPDSMILRRLLWPHRVLCRPDFGLRGDRPRMEHRKSGGRDSRGDFRSPVADLRKRVLR